VQCVAVFGSRGVMGYDGESNRDYCRDSLRTAVQHKRETQREMNNKGEVIHWVLVIKVSV